MADTTYFSSEQIQKKLGIGRTAFYALVSRRDLRALKVGRRIRVSAQALDEFLEQAELKQEASNV